jgi:hypothetical protein
MNITALKKALKSHIIMKKLFIIIFAAFFMAATLISFGQEETKTKEKSEYENKCSISYAFINEYGTYLGGAFGFTGIFVNGVRFNKTQDVIGIGVGYEVGSESPYPNYYYSYDTPQSIPLFVNYRHYFPGKRALKPLVNIGIGTRISFWKEWTGYYVDYEVDGYPYPTWMSEPEEQKIKAGLYTTIAAGFKVKAFSFTSGFFLKSCYKNYFGGVEVKAGFTF